MAGDKTGYKHFYPGDVITRADLQAQWLQTLSFYDEQIENGRPLRPIRFLIRHMIQRGYDEHYFPGTSLWNLLISITENNRVSYDKTIRIEVDYLRHNIKFLYTDYSGLDRNKVDFKKALKWSEVCQLTEICDKFEYFISINPEWQIQEK
jgi:hypothetical protein